MNTQQEERRAIHSNLKPLIRILSVIQAIALTIVVLIISVALLEKPSIRFINQPFPTDHAEKEPYKPGDPINFTVEVCAKRDTEYKQVRRLRNVDTGEIFIFNEIKAAVKKGCPFELSNATPITLNNNLNTGTYVMEFDIAIPGYIRQHRMTTTSATFEVISSTE